MVHGGPGETQPGGVERWDGPYLKKDVPVDPWGKPYVYKSPGDHGPFDILSMARNMERERSKNQNPRETEARSHQSSRRESNP